MVKFLESFLTVLNAFQPLITFFIGCAAVYISAKTYRNAQLSRLHDVNMQIAGIKRDIIKLLTEYIELQRSNLSELNGMRSILSTLKIDDLQSELMSFDDGVKDMEEHLKSAEIVVGKYITKLEKINEVDSALDLLFYIERSVINLGGRSTNILKKYSHILVYHQYQDRINKS